MVFKRDTKSKQTLATVRLQGKLRGLAYSPDAKYVAVGNDHGDLFILKSSDLSQIHFQKYEKPKTAKGNIHAVEVLRFSPDGRYLAVGSHDDVVYIWQLGSSFKVVGTCKGHSSFITHLDWSKDSSFIQTNSGDYELLFWSIPSCKQIGSASSMKDVEWETFSCILGWPVQGIWEKGMAGDDINTVDRHPSGTCLVSGDDFLHVRLHVYPSAREGLPFKTYMAHGAHVTKVCFTCDGSRVISTGGLDGCTFQWRVEGGKARRQQDDGSDGERSNSRQTRRSRDSDSDDN
ncbi:WD40-repeat-containing domain protein [Zopfochytrium polystomum]|nr:WD40-repeat-containing domain protein [Zopfochytrium polystomum]